MNDSSGNQVFDLDKEIFQTTSSQILINLTNNGTTEQDSPDEPGANLTSILKQMFQKANLF